MAQRSPAIKQRRDDAEGRAHAAAVVAHFETVWRPRNEYPDISSSEPGLYGIWLPRGAWDELGLNGSPRTDGGWIYIGKAERSINSRVLKRHLGYGEKCTGWSSPRRSLVALLHATRNWKIQPRDPSRPGNYANYGLAQADEAALGSWLAERAVISDWPWDRSRPLRDIEKDVIKTLNPPFNLTHSCTPWTRLIRAKRAECAALAREWAAARGMHPSSGPPPSSLAP